MTAAHLGIARELSNYFNLSLLENSNELKSNIENLIKVNSGRIKACNSYQSIEIENFKLDDSSLQIRYRLSSVGVRVINNVVDYTNYVLHDIGNRYMHSIGINYMGLYQSDLQKIMKF